MSMNFWTIYFFMFWICEKLYVFERIVQEIMGLNNVLKIGITILFGMLESAVDELRRQQLARGIRIRGMFWAHFRGFQVFTAVFSEPNRAKATDGLGLIRTVRLAQWGAHLPAARWRGGGGRGPCHTSARQSTAVLHYAIIAACARNISRRLRAFWRTLRLGDTRYTI